MDDTTATAGARAAGLGPTQMRHIVGDALMAVAYASYAVAAAVLVMLVKVWSDDAGPGRPDFPGHLLFALVPPLVFAVGLHIGSLRVRVG